MKLSKPTPTDASGLLEKQVFALLQVVQLPPSITMAEQSRFSVDGDDGGVFGSGVVDGSGEVDGSGSFDGGDGVADGGGVGGGDGGGRGDAAMQ